MTNSLILDNFLDETSYNELKQHTLDCTFSDITNPLDGVTYPDINIGISEEIKQEILSKLQYVFGSDIDSTMMFLRMSKEGTHCPHIHHHDLSHGQYSLMLYLNGDTLGGTSLVRHIDTGCTYAPGSQSFVDYLSTDINDLTKWEAYNSCGMCENRAFIFDAGLFHRAEPIGGFGTNQEDARIVLTCFFSLGGQ